MRKGIGEYCGDNNICSIPNTICSHEKSCICKENFIESDGKCKPAINGQCTSPLDCVVENSECIKMTNEKRNSKVSNNDDDQKFCTCKKEYVHTKGECLKKG